MTSLGDYTLLIYSPPGLGKTTLAGQFEKCFHMLYEPGGKAFRLFSRTVKTWEDTQEYLKLIEDNPDRFRTVCVDVIEAAFDKCFAYMVREHFEGHSPHYWSTVKKDYGAAWGRLRKEFQAFLFNLLNLDCGIVLISHERMAKVEQRDGSELEMYRADLSDSPWNTVEGLIDIILRIDYDMDSVDPDKRCMWLRGPHYMSSKCRPKENFLTPEGKRVISIPCGNSEEEAYTNLIRAFNNKQDTVYAHPRQVRKKPLRKKRASLKKKRGTKRKRK